MAEDSTQFIAEEMVEERKTKRINWNNKLEFVLNVVGYNVGLGNVWRFSYLCYKNGGGAFVFCYLLVGVCCALPLFFQEIAMGQFTQMGAIGVWNMLPVMQGIGYSQLMIALYSMLYYLLIMGWCLFYMFNSFTKNLLPWSTCGNTWNTDYCVPIIADSNMTNASTSQIPLNISDTVASTTEFWNHYVLRKTEGIEDMGSFTNWKVLLCYLASWVICYLCIMRGIRSTGKVAYFTALFPYVVMLCLLIRAVLLEGALNGVLFYVTPDITRLSDPQVWFDAVTQVLYSLGVCFTVLFSLGSYNKRSFDAYKYSFLFVAICCGSSFFVGFVVFSFIGHLAHMQNKNVSEVAAGGPGLVFEVYPAGVSLLPLSQIWSVLFFIMLSLLAVDTVFGTMEGCFTALADIWPDKFGYGKKQKYKLGICFTLMLLGLPQLFDGGIYIFQLLNYYGSSGICLLTIAFCECFGIAWVYGVDRFYRDVESMIGYQPGIAMKLCFKYTAPLIILVIFVYYCILYKPITLGNYEYPWWGDVIGWLFTISVILPIPVVAVRKMLLAKGSLKQRWVKVTTTYGNFSRDKIYSEAKESCLEQEMSADLKPL